MITDINKVKINELVVLEKCMKSYSIQPLFHTLSIRYLFVHSHLIVIHKVSQKDFINYQNSKSMDTKFARAKIDCDCVHLIVWLCRCASMQKRVTITRFALGITMNAFELSLFHGLLKELVLTMTPNAN